MLILGSIVEGSSLKFKWAHPNVANLGCWVAKIESTEGREFSTRSLVSDGDV